MPGAGVAVVPAAVVAVAFGSSNLRIMFKELVPNAMAAIVVAATGARSSAPRSRPSSSDRA